MTIVKKIPRRNYIDNKKFLQALRDYRELCIDAENGGDPRPPIPNYIGECIFQLARNIAKHRSFANYPFIEDMIGDAMEDGIKCLNRDNFDVDRSNPFAYFTKIMRWAFIRRIEKEKMILYKSGKYAGYMMTTPEVQQDQGATETISNMYETDYMIDFMEKMDEKKREKNGK